MTMTFLSRKTISQITSSYTTILNVAFLPDIHIVLYCTVHYIALFHFHLCGVCVCVRMRLQCLQRSDEAIRLLRIGVAGGCESLADMPTGLSPR